MIPRTDTDRSSTVLVVDDDPQVVHAIKMILEKMGEYDVMVARSGPECLRKVKETTPDLILLDILMPSMDGVQVLRELKANPAFRDVPVLMVSVDARLERMAACFEFGANGFLIKPFDTASLYRQVRNAVTRRKVVKLQNQASPY